MHATIQNHRRDFLRSIANRRYEQTANGIYLPEQKVHVGGVFTARVDDGPKTVTHNTFVNEGLLLLLNVMFHGTTQVGTWYIAPFSGNVTPAPSLTAATFNSTQTEFINYTQANRVQWVEAAASGNAITNTASLAEFTMDTGGGTIWGCGMLSSNGKQDTAGSLAAAGKFGAAQVLTVGSKLLVEYSVTAADA